MRRANRQRGRPGQGMSTMPLGKTRLSGALDIDKGAHTSPRPLSEAWFKRHAKREMQTPPQSCHPIHHEQFHGAPTYGSQESRHRWHNTQELW